jgi:hypothetical protein
MTVVSMSTLMRNVRRIRDGVVVVIPHSFLAPLHKEEGALVGQIRLRRRFSTHDESVSSPKSQGGTRWWRPLREAQETWKRNGL